MALEEFRVSVSEQTLSRGMRAMGDRKLAAWPKHHAQDPQAIEAFKKLPRRRGGNYHRSNPRQKRLEIWFEDEASIGQKNKITHRWAKRGTRPSAPHDQRTRSAYIFGAMQSARSSAATPMP